LTLYQRVTDGKTDGQTEYIIAIDLYIRLYLFSSTDTI